MPRASRFDARWNGSAMKWAGARNRRRIVRSVAAAVADDVPVNWRALAQTPGTPAERDLLGSFQTIAQWRARTRSAEAAPSTTAGVLTTLVSALAGAQLLVAFGLVAAALIGGGAAVLMRSPQLWMAAAFTAGALILVRAHHDPRARFLVAAYLGSGVAFARRPVALADGPPLLDLAATWFYPEAFLAFFLWQFVTEFPRVDRFAPLDRVSRAVSVLAMALSIWLLGATFAVAAGWAGPAGLAGAFERSKPLFWYVTAALSLPALFVMQWRARRAPDLERGRVRRFAWSLAICAAPFFFLEVALMLAPGFRQWFRAVPPSAGRVWIEIPVIASFIAIPVLTAAAVVRDRTFDLRAWFARATRHALAQGTLTAAIVVALGLLAGIAYANRGETIGAVIASPAGAVLMAAAAVAGLALATRRPLVRLIDPAFLRSPVDRTTALRDALEFVRRARGRRELALAVTNHLQNALKADVQVLTVTTTAGWTADDVADDQLLADSALVALAGQIPEPLDFDQAGRLWRLLPSGDREWLERRHFTSLAPVVGRGGQLLAIVLLGQKRDRLPLTPDDRWFIASLTTAAAAAWQEDRPRELTHDDSALECVSCGTVAAARPLACACASGAQVAALPALLLDRFQVTRRLGAGGMGVVYHGEDRALHRPVALKTLPSLSGGSIERVRQEARMTAAVIHPSIATVHDLVVWRDTPVLVLEYLSGGTLAQQLKRGPMRLDAVVTVAADLTSALSRIHAAGFLHRDIKPSNVGLDAAGTVKLLDFGIASLVNGSQEFAGTPAYWPPEADEGVAVSAMYDLWALSVLLFECLTATHPFLGGEAESARTKGFAARRGRLPPVLEQYFKRALSVNPSLRPETAEVLGREFCTAATAFDRGDN
jgi:hypothetical protein